MTFRSNAGLIGLGLFLLLHAGSVSAQGNQPPQVSPIQATFIAPDTFYSLEASDPEGDALSVEWGYVGIGGCTAFTSMNPQGTLALWGPHDQDPPCVHDASGGHPITVIATVSDPCGNSVRRSYEGSLDGVGPAGEPDFQPQLYRGAVVPLRTTPCFSPTPTGTTFITTELPDLAPNIVVTGIAADGASSIVGRPTAVRVTAVNRGTAPGSETVTVEITNLEDDTPGFLNLFLARPPVSFQVRFENLAPGQSREETFTWTPGDSGNWEIKSGDQSARSETFRPELAPGLTIDTVPNFDGPMPEFPSETPPQPEIDTEEVM